LHPHLKDQAGGRQGNKRKQQTNARRAEAADGGGSGGPSKAQLQEMFAAFMLTQNQSTPGPRREDSYSGSTLELKVPVTPMSNTDQTRIRAGATPWRSKTLQARVAATTLTRKGPERQRLAGPQSNMPLGFLQQGPLTSRLRGGGEEDDEGPNNKAKAVLNRCDACSRKGHKTQDCPKRLGKKPAEEPEGDAEAVSKGQGEPEETMPGPEEPAGTKPGLQESSGTKGGSPGGRQTRSRTDALLRKEETNVGKPKNSEDVPKGFEELPRDDPQCQGIQGFRFGDFEEEFPSLRGRKNTTSGITKGAKKGPADDMEIVKELVGGNQPGSNLAPSSTGKAPEDTAAVESVSHPPAPIPFAEAPEASVQQRSLPVPHSNIRRFDAADMLEAGPSVTVPKMRTIRLPGETRNVMFDQAPLDWSATDRNSYNRPGVQMFLGGAVTQGIRDFVGLLFSSPYVTRSATAEHGLANYLFRGAYTPGMDSITYKLMRLQGANVYPKFEDISAEDGARWTDGERTERTARSICQSDQAQHNALAIGTYLTAAELQMLGKGLAVLAGWLMEVPMEPLAIELWTWKDVLNLSQNQEYRLAICQYILELAQSILKGEAHLSKDETDAHKLLVEFYWALHKIPAYLLGTDSEGCAEKVCFRGPALAGLRELWKLMGGINSAGAQTLLRRMALQLGELERSGCIRLDQVWNVLTDETQQTAMDMAITKFQRDLCITPEAWVERAEHIRGQILKAQAFNKEHYGKRHARKERSPSVESTEIVAEIGPGEKGKQQVGQRVSKRAKAEVVETPEVETPPDFMEVNPKAWQENKQREGTYRYNYGAWKDVKPPHNPWLVQGNKAGLYMAQGPLWVRVPQVVETCRKVYGGTASSSKIQAFELYVPLPGGKVHKCPSMKAMWDLCYAVGTSAMFTAAEAAERGDLARLWQNKPRARVANTKKAVALLDQAAQGAETLPMDIFGPVEDVTATPLPSPSRSPALTPTPVRTTAPQPQAEARRGAAAVIPTPAVRPVQDQRVSSVDPQFPTAYTVQEPPSEVEGTSTSVSVPASSGPEHAAAHPSVKHFTDTLVRMGYLDDLHKGVFMLRDRLGDEVLRRRNKVAKHIKSRDDAKEAMLVLCREGKVDLLGNNFFRVLHFEEDEEPAGRTRSNPEATDSQPPKKKPKQTRAKPKVRKSVSSGSAQSANLYDAKNPQLRALLAGLPSSQVGNRETGVHKAPRIDNSGPNPACLINGKVLSGILLDYGSESVITGRAGARQMGLKPSMMDLGTVALRVADGGTTKAFDRTKHPVEFVFNPKIPDETKVLSHVIVVNSENADTLLGMSVLGKIGLTTNPYKGRRVKYYVNWKEPNARKAYLKSTFPVDRPSPALAASSSGQEIRVVNAASAVQLPLPLDSPRNGFATTSTQFRLRAHHSQLTPELTNLMYRSKQALTVSEPVQPRAADPYGHLRPLDARLVDIFSMPAAQEEGLVVVELFSGISATTEALLRAGVKIKKLYCCEIDPKTQAVIKARASDWL
jgi:hypothetical protein